MSFLPQLGVGPTGSDIDNDVMDRVLRSASIGSSIGLAILNTSEATAMFYLESSHGFDFHQVNPSITELLMPVCIGGHIGPGHYVLLHVSIPQKIITLMDSCASTTTTADVDNHVRLLTSNIWGHRSTSAVFVFARVDQQATIVEFLFSGWCVASHRDGMFSLFSVVCQFTSSTPSAATSFAQAHA